MTLSFRHPGEGRGRQVTARNRRPTPNMTAPAYAGVTAFHLPHPASATTAATGVYHV